MELSARRTVGIAPGSGWRMADEDTFIIGNWGNIIAKHRIRASGKARATLEIKSDGPIVVDTNARRAGELPAKAIEEAIRDRLKGVMEIAGPSSLSRRKRAAEAFRNGKRWAMKDYSGGRIGPMAPNQTVRWGNDSGRLAKSLAMMWNEKNQAYMLNVAANRLTPEFIARNSTFLPKLVNEVVRPALDDERIPKAERQALINAATKVRDGQAEARKRLLDSARGLVDAGRGLGSELGEFGDEE